MINKATAQTIPVEREIIVEAWEMLKAYAMVNTSTTKKEWNDMLARADKVSKLGGDTAAGKLAMDISIAVMGYLNRRYEEAKARGGHKAITAGAVKAATGQQPTVKKVSKFFTPRGSA